MPKWSEPGNAVFAGTADRYRQGGGRLRLGPGRQTLHRFPEWLGDKPARQLSSRDSRGVEAANRRFGFHYDHPLRYDLAEMLADIMPGKALPRTNYEVSGTEAAEAAVHLALTHTKRRYIITFSSSYHGMGLGTKVLSGLDGSYGTYLEGWGGGVIKAPYPLQRANSGRDERGSVHRVLPLVPR